MTTDATQYPPAAAPPDAAPAPESQPPHALHYYDQDYRPLDPRALRLWQLTDGLGMGVFLLMAVVGGAVMAFFNPGTFYFVVGAWLAIAALGAWTVLFYHPRNYRSWGYRVDERVLLIKRGVWFRSVKLLPLPRLQHVDIKRGPLQRKFGLASLTLHTAGTHAASIELPGLDADEAARLRDRLVAAGGDDGV